MDSSKISSEFFHLRQHFQKFFSRLTSNSGSLCFVLLLLLVILQLNNEQKSGVVVKTKLNVTQWKEDSSEKKLRNAEMTSFKDYNTANTKTFHMVCLTNRKVELTWSTTCADKWVSNCSETPTFFCRECLHAQKYITVYLQSEEEVRNHTKNNYRYDVGYDLAFKHKNQLPKDYVIKDETAYFLGRTSHPQEPQNFFHFVKQIYFPLYWLIRSTNQLHSQAKNVVFHASPYAVCDRGQRIIYHNPDKFKSFKDLLKIQNKLELSAFVDKLEPHQVCYRNAIFSSHFFLDKAKEAIDYFKQSQDVTDDVCQPKTLTLINRASYRKIVNADKLIEIAKYHGYNAKEVLMEKLTMKEQAQLIHCTNVLVGVAGAGVHWGYFMKDNSSVFEIAWPDKEWHFFFSATNGTYRSEEMDVIRPLKFHQILAKCELYPPAVNMYIKEMFYRDENLSYQQSLDILQDERNYDYKSKNVISVGKLCNAVVDEVAFKDALMETN